MFAGGETVTRLRAPLTLDPYSNLPDDRDWSQAASRKIPGCGIADGGSLEPVIDARTSVESDFDVILPAGTDLLASDRIVVRGLTCEIQGRPFDWRNPFTGWTPGMLAKAKIVEG